MTLVSSFLARYRTFIVPALILLTSIVMSGYLIHAKIAHAGLTYGWSVTHACFDAGWPPGCNTTDYTPGGCLGGCSASNLGEHCQRLQCTNLPPACTGDFVNIDCVVTGCTPDNTCGGARANTCTTTTCDDGCGGQLQGQLNCASQCTATNICGASNTGTLVNSVCSASPPALPPGYGNSCSSAPNSCSMTNTGTIGCSGSCSASTPSDFLCGPPPVCTPDNTCGGARANTCTTTTCDDGCGNALQGQKVCVGPPVCSNPTITVTATPNRVKSGNTSVIKITGTGLTSACTITGPGVNQTLTPSSCTLSPNPTTITTPAITAQSTYTVTCTDIATPTKVMVNLTPNFNPF